MGSSGMKKKGRQHLPKVGSKPQREYSQRHQRDALAENMGFDVESHSVAEKVGVAVIAVIIVAGMIAFMFMT